jgi:hypothetical protein
MHAPQMRSPPSLPLPNPSEDPDWYGEFLLKYPVGQAVYQMQHPHCFKAKMDFAVDINYITIKLYDIKDNQTPTSKAKDLMSFASKLRKWYYHLPSQLWPENIFLPIHFKVQ